MSGTVNTVRRPGGLPFGDSGQMVFDGGRDINDPDVIVFGMRRFVRSSRRELAM